MLSTVSSVLSGSEVVPETKPPLGANRGGTSSFASKVPRECLTKAVKIKEAKKRPKTREDIGVQLLSRSLNMTL